MKLSVLKLATLGIMATTAAMPIIASADDRRPCDDHHAVIQNQWKNLTIGSAAVGLIGLATHNRTLAVAGVAGAVYSDYRFQENRHDNDYRRYDRDDHRGDRDRDRNRDRDRDRDRDGRGYRIHEGR